MTSPARRVLGDKDKNAPLNTQSLKQTALASMASMAEPSIPKKTHEMLPPFPSPLAGSKRKIEEVDSAERIEKDELQDSQRTQLLSDTESDDDQQNHTSNSNAYQSYETTETSLDASQNPIEPHFELPQDEMSQKTLDRMNDVPMPQNTSQLPPLHPAFLKEFSAGSQGLSTFINFEGPPSSQGSDQVQPLKPVKVEKSKPDDVSKPAEKDTSESEVAARKKMLSEKAAELQTRLQLALYKVQTKQTSQPFSRLKVPKPPRDRSSSPPTNWMPVLRTPQLSSSTIKEPSSVRTVTSAHQHDRSIFSAEAGIAAMRAQATAQLKPPVRNLNSLPIPQLDPELLNPAASFDSNKTQLLTEIDSQDIQHFPSSPPLSRQHSGTSDELLLPGLLEAANKPMETQLSSPPVSERGADDNDDGAELAKTSSAIKGEAASGLVQLLHSGS